MQSVSYFAGQEQRVRYWAAYSFVFSSPNWWKTLLTGGVAMLVPILGPVVLIGYLCDVLAPRPIDDGTGRLDEPPAAPGAAYPDFDFARLSQYLERGIWPFVATLVVGIAMLPLYLVALVPVIIAAATNARGAGLWRHSPPRLRCLLPSLAPAWLRWFRCRCGQPCSWTSGRRSPSTG